jgi:hypothetical protein
MPIGANRGGHPKALMVGAERNYLDLFPPGRSVVTDAASTGGGFHSAIARTHAGALA